ncbi:MAG: CvpA family protein [Balneolales bacterium]
MNLIDLIILVPLILFAVRGFKNGLIKELFGALGLVLAIFFSFQYMAELSAFIRVQLETDTAFVPYFSFGIIFLVVLLAVQVLIYFAEGVLNLVFLSLPNRLLGSVFSTLKSALVISVIFLIFSGFSLPDDETASDSLFYPYIIQLAPLTYDTLAQFYPGASNYIEAVQDALEKHSIIDQPSE